MLDLLGAVTYFAAMLLVPFGIWALMYGRGGGTNMIGSGIILFGIYFHLLRPNGAVISHITAVLIYAMGIAVIVIGERERRRAKNQTTEWYL